MTLHINKPTNNKMKKSESNIVNTKIKKPKHEYTEKPKRRPVKYSSIRTDKRVICQIKALNLLLHDKTIADTLSRMLKISKSKFVTGKKSVLFDVYYKMWMNKIK